MAVNDQMMPRRNGIFVGDRNEVFRMKSYAFIVVNPVTKNTVRIQPQ